MSTITRCLRVTVADMSCGRYSWGNPEAPDVGSLAIRVVERKSYPSPGSPSKLRRSADSRKSQHEATGSEDSEQVVGRFVLDVTDRRSVG